MIESGFIHGDCMDYLKEYPDNYFDLCIADPPYGDGGGVTSQSVSVDGLTVTNRMVNRGGGTGNTSTTWDRFGGRFDRYKTPIPRRQQMGQVHGKKIIAWDTAPEKSFFDELFRVSRNQIIWGANYFEMPPTRCFVVWRKLTISEKFSMAMAEYAWTSFNDNAKVYEHVSQDPTGARFHPTQKPVDLYEWLINTYAQPGDKILDPMAGSGSCLVACHRTGHDFVGFEIDDVYYDKAKKRLDDEMAQTTIFDFLND